MTQSGILAACGASVKWRDGGPAVRSAVPGPCWLCYLIASMVRGGWSKASSVKTKVFSEGCGFILLPF